MSILKKIYPILITLVVGFIGFYVLLPPLNIKSPVFTGYALILTIIYIVLSLPSVGSFSNLKSLKVKSIPIVILLAIIIFNFIMSLVSNPIFHAKSYRNQIQLVESSFEEDIAELSFNQIPTVDKDTAERLGIRKIGEVVELVSQFEVSSIFTQINYESRPFRVSPLGYADFIKWFNNKKEGIPYYVTIDMTSQNTNLVRMEKGMKYSTSAYFNENLTRHARFKYPTLMFDEYFFEIDDQGKPYWIISVYDYQIMWNGGKNTKGIILIDAETGETSFQDNNNIPNWIDNVYPSALIVNQINNYGKYVGGFINSVVGQKGVLSSTDGYNYIAFDDDVWLFTGLTSVGRDESNIGFVLVNKRTKQAKYYPVNGAEEYSAMSSAQGKVQETGYRATFPILLNIANKPTYFISLKDNAGLVKQYAFVSVENYQLVGIGNNIQEARSDYMRQLLTLGTEIDYVGAEMTGKIVDIQTAVKNGNSLYYIKLDSSQFIFLTSIEMNEILPILKLGDEVVINYLESTQSIKTVNDIKIK